MNAPVPRAKAQQGLRIGYVFSQFPVLTEAFAVSDIAALVGQGHHVRVFTMKPRRRGDRRLRQVAGVPDNLRICAPTLAGALRWPSLVWRYRRVAVQLAGAAIRAMPESPSAAVFAFLCIPRALEIADDARRSGLDVVHIFWSRQGGMVLPALQSDGASCVRSAFVGAYDLVADDFLVGLTLRSANVVFSHAEANRDFAQSRAGGSVPVRIIRRGIPLLRTLPEQRDPFAWITASALTQSKNVEAVLCAFAKAHEQDGRLKLTICGDGPYRERLEALSRQLGIGSAVEFAGHVPRDELYRRLNRAALFILLSKKPSERLPNVLKEALWAGCAVICSPSEGIDELIPNDRMGSVVDPDDVDSIVRTSSRLLGQSDEDAEARRAEARAFIEANFSSDRSMAEYVEAWDACRRTENSQAQTAERAFL